MVQHNALITARYEMSAAEKNIIYMLLSQLKKDDPVDKVYEISMGEIEKLTGNKLNNKQVEKSAEKLLSSVYTILENGNLLQVCIIASARYISGSGKVAIEIAPAVRPYLFDLKKNFTKLGFYVVMSLKSKYSKRIYEMLCQFKSTGVMYISLEELKGRLRPVATATKPTCGKYTHWFMFKKAVLEVARKELEEKGDIYFTYKADKVGNKFTNLEFRIHQAVKLPDCIPNKLKESDTYDKPTNTDYSLLYKNLIGTYRLSAWQAKLVVEKIPEKDISKTLYDIKLRILNNELKNVGGFTAQTFENKYQLGLVGKKISI